MRPTTNTDAYSNANSDTVTNADTVTNSVTNPNTDTRWHNADHQRVSPAWSKRCE